MSDLGSAVNELIAKGAGVKLWIELDLPAGAAPPITPPVEPPADDGVFKFYNVRGIAGEKFVLDAGKTDFATGERISFNFKITNTTPVKIYYSIAAAFTDEGPHAYSYTNESLNPGESLDWRDGFVIDTPGTYHIRLGIGFDPLDEIKAGRAPWYRLSDSIAIVIH